MIKYQYAYNSTRKLVKIDQIKDKEEKFTCINCKNELIPRTGKINVHHFAHKTTVDCNSETYLHKLGKELFEQEFNYCIENRKPFYIELYQQKYCSCSEAIYKDKCYLGEELVKFDLTKHFNKIILEQKIDQFKPDLLLPHIENTNQIFIEIAVTHHSSENKLNSNFRIIELTVEKESDLDSITQHILTEGNSFIKFHNFNVKNVYEPKSVSNCDKDIDLFVVYKSGKCYMNTISLNRLQSEMNFLKQSSTYQSAKELSFEHHVVDAYKSNYITKNCYLCAHHEKARPSWDFQDDYENRGKSIYCYKKSTRCNSNDGIECCDFKLSQRKINEYTVQNNMIEGKS